MSRLKFTKEMEAANLEWAKRAGLKTFDSNGNGSDGEDDQEDIRADGDSHLDLGKDFDDFSVPPCSECGGVMMPELVFFGGSIRKEVKDAAAKISCLPQVCP